MQEFIAEVPFDSNRKRMSVLYSQNGKKIVWTKGALEKVLEECTHEIAGEGIRKLDDARKADILGRNAEMASSGLRVLGFAFKEYVGSSWTVTQKSDPFTQRDAYNIEFKVKVPANSEKKVTYTVEHRYYW